MTEFAITTDRLKTHQDASNALALLAGCWIRHLMDWVGAANITTHWHTIANLPAFEAFGVLPNEDQREQLVSLRIERTTDPDLPLALVTKRHPRIVD